MLSIIDNGSTRRPLLRLSMRLPPYPSITQWPSSHQWPSSLHIYCLLYLRILAFASPFSAVSTTSAIWSATPSSATHCCARLLNDTPCSARIYCATTCSTQSLVIPNCKCSYELDCTLANCYSWSSDTSSPGSRTRRGNSESTTTSNTTSFCKDSCR
jgi:hypothetical protein